jgi:invasion protein IalB
LKKVSALVAAALVSGAVMATTAIAMAPAYAAQDRQSVATTPDAAGAWEFTGSLYAKKTDCVDAGQQYEREGFPYRCEGPTWIPVANEYMYGLYIEN